MFTHSTELKQQLQAAYVAKGSDYVPRTQHLDDQGQAVYINRLIFQDSPYLLQHAHNPVDWHPWGPEAFALAQRENKPVFLSIGYSTCHWCHVMEIESFEDESIAAYMDEHFISIKVDRELLPDIDAIYMTAVMMMNGQGGWPMSSFLTANGKPFYGGTYYPPQQFLHLLQQVYKTWTDEHDQFLEQANVITREINRIMSARQKATSITNDTIEKAVQNVISSYDSTYGGFGSAPKFPNEPNLFLLLEAAVHFDNAFDLDVLNKTLQQMAQGGIYDHVGGGFHRYSTDQHWLVPHFEKMLYNQANLARIYMHAYELTGNDFYKQVVSETLDYVLREMTDSEGGFYSATDADSEGREGAFFVWEKKDLKSLLSTDEFDLAVDVFGVRDDGNFEGENILFLPESYLDYAEQNKLDINALHSDVARIKQKLLVARNKRIAPLRDDKIITAWNGMMIMAFSAAGKGLQRDDYTDAAIKAANHLLDLNRQDDGRLWRSSLNGRPSINGKQEDYAYLAEALIQLYDDNRDERWLNEAEKISATMIDQFLDKDAGGFFMSVEEPGISLPTRPKDLEDNAVPSGNSVALRVLAKLAKRLGKQDYSNHAEALIAGLSEKIDKYPHAYAYLQTALLEFLNHEHTALQYAARGKLNIESSIKLDGQAFELSILIKVKPEWHINADKPLSKDLIPTQLTVEDGSPWELLEVSYPEASIESLSFSKTELALYKDTIMITALLKRHLSASDEDELKLIKLQLQIQACNDDTCLAPESVPVIVSMVVN
jgi:uncharacterized protein YyaL (SSP411 family)